MVIYIQLQVVFTTNENRNETAETNRTINFAMDSIQLFDYNCTCERVLERVENDGDLLLII